MGRLCNLDAKGFCGRYAGKVIDASQLCTKLLRKSFLRDLSIGPKLFIITDLLKLLQEKNSIIFSNTGRNLAQIL